MTTTVTPQQAEIEQAAAHLSALLSRYVPTTTIDYRIEDLRPLLQRIVDGYPHPVVTCDEKARRAEADDDAARWQVEMLADLDAAASAILD